MKVMLDDRKVVSIPWHDAEIYFMKTLWSENEELQVLMRVEINPEESLKPLVDVGLHGAVFDVTFLQVWRLKSDLYGDSFPKEVLMDWNIVMPSSLVDDVKRRGMAESIEIRHHQMVFSNGSVVDIVFEEMSMESV